MFFTLAVQKKNVFLCSVAGTDGDKVGLSGRAIVHAYDRRYGDRSPRKHSGPRRHGDLSPAAGNRGARGENRGGFQNVSAMSHFCLVTRPTTLYRFPYCVLVILFLGGDGTQ